MTKFICTACGTSFPDAEQPPDACPICLDERQFVPRSGQSWTTENALASGHRAVFAYDGPMFGIGLTPSFAIGQRALLVRTAAGNVLWDLIPLLDPAMVEIIRALGGLAGIAISHPHYYGNLRAWTETFQIPVYCHGDDAQWIVDPVRGIERWTGERLTIAPGLTLVRCGGHFAGGTVLHVNHSASGLAHDTLLSGDILQVTPGGNHVAFMRSYPNLIPLGPDAVREMVAALDGLDFETVLGAFWDRVIPRDGRAVVEHSAERHIAWVSGRGA